MLHPYPQNSKNTESQGFFVDAKPSSSTIRAANSNNVGADSAINASSKRPPSRASVKSRQSGSSSTTTTTSTNSDEDGDNEDNDSEDDCVITGITSGRTSSEAVKRARQFLKLTAATTAPPSVANDNNRAMANRAAEQQTDPPKLSTLTPAPCCSSSATQTEPDCAIALTDCHSDNLTISWPFGPTASSQSALLGRQMSPPMTLQQLDQLALDCVRQMTDSGRYPESRLVLELMSQRVGPSRLWQWGINSTDRVPLLRRLHLASCQATLNVQALVRQRNLITLAEVVASLSTSRGLSTDIALLGNPLRFPVVRDNFWPDPSLTEVPQINSLEVLNYLEEFSSSRGRRLENSDCDAFLSYLCAQRGVPSPQHLCVKISKFGALLGALFGTLKLARNDQLVIRHRESVRQAALNRIRCAFDTLLSSLLRQSSASSGWKLRRPLARMQPLDCLREVAANYACLVDSLREATDGLTGLSMQTSIANFLKAVELEGPLAQRLLHLALCATADNDTKKLRRDAETMRRRIFGLNAGEADQKKCSKCRCSPSKQNNSVVIIDDSSSDSSSDGSSDGSIDTSTAASSNNPCSKEDQNKKQQQKQVEEPRASVEESVRFLLGRLSSASGSDGQQSLPINSLSATLEELQAELAERCCHGDGQDAAAALLLNSLSKDARLAGALDAMFVHASSTSSAAPASRRGGQQLLHGAVIDEISLIPASNIRAAAAAAAAATEDAATAEALAALADLPLLADAERRLAWDIRFAPRLGTLEDFIAANAAEAAHRHSLLFLRSGSGCLRRLAADASLEAFRAAVTSGDARSAAGQLASLLAVNRRAVDKPMVSAERNDADDDEFPRAAVRQLAAEAAAGWSRQARVDFASRLACRLPACVAAALGFDTCVGGLLDDREPAIVGEFAASLTDDERRRLAACWPQQQLRLASHLPSSLSSSSLRSVAPAASSDVKSPTLPNVTTVASAAAATADDFDDSVDLDSSSCQAVIVDSIRRRAFGIVASEGDVDGEADTAPNALREHHERLGRSLERLSRDLYSGEAHFLLELLQNADDNAYADGVTPAVCFHLAADGSQLTVSCNELGFTPRSARAICDVGCSTKSAAHSSGRIGHKGIGFKAVFRVSDAPEIHSGNFHFRFDLTRAGPLGCVLPHWLPGLPKVSGTEIRIPLREPVGPDSPLLEELRPELLLFLNRLRRLKIVAGEARETSLVCLDAVGWHSDDRDDVAVRLETRGGKDGELISASDYLLVSQTVDIGDGRVSRLTAAVPLYRDAFSDAVIDGADVDVEESGADDDADAEYPVFAYLPLRSFGFRFLLQGDFEIPSSREDIRRDSAWNERLRDRLPSLLTAVYAALSRRCGPLIAASRCFELLPLETELQGFFRPACRAVLAAFRRLAWLPVASGGAKPDGEPQLHPPGSVLAAATDDVVGDGGGGGGLLDTLGLTEPDEIRQLLGAWPAHPKLLTLLCRVRQRRGQLNLARLRQLQHTLGMPAPLAASGDAAAAMLLRLVGPDCGLADWRAAAALLDAVCSQPALFRRARASLQSVAFVPALRGLHPIKDRLTVCLRDSLLILPPVSTSSDNADSLLGMDWPSVCNLLNQLYPSLPRLCILDTEALDSNRTAATAEQPHSPLVTRLVKRFEQLGARYPDRQLLFSDCLLPALRSDVSNLLTSGSSAQASQRLLRLADAARRLRPTELRRSASGELADILPLLLSDGRVVLPSQHPDIHLPSELLLPPTDSCSELAFDKLQWQPQSRPWKVISSAYFSDQAGADSLTDWRRFLVDELGVLDGPLESPACDYPELAGILEEADESAMLGHPPGSVSDADLMSLFDHLSRCWRRRYSRHRPDGRFGRAVRSAAWLPARSLIWQRLNRRLPEDGRLAPSSVHLPGRAVDSLGAADFLPVLRPDIADAADFLADIGVRSDGPTPAEVAEALFAWSDDDGDATNNRPVLRTSFSRMTELYRFCWRGWDCLDERLRAQLAQQPAVFLPADESDVSQQLADPQRRSRSSVIIVKGQFVLGSDAIWNDASDDVDNAAAADDDDNQSRRLQSPMPKPLLTELRSLVSLYYPPDLADFFTVGCGVLRRPCLAWLEFNLVRACRRVDNGVGSVALDSALVRLAVELPNCDQKRRHLIIDRIRQLPCLPRLPAGRCRPADRPAVVIDVDGDDADGDGEGVGVEVANSDGNDVNAESAIDDDFLRQLADAGAQLVDLRCGRNPCRKLRNQLRLLCLSDSLLGLPTVRASLRSCLFPDDAEQQLDVPELQLQAADLLDGIQRWLYCVRPACYAEIVSNGFPDVLAATRLAAVQDLSTRRYLAQNPFAAVLIRRPYALLPSSLSGRRLLLVDAADARADSRPAARRRCQALLSMILQLAGPALAPFTEDLRALALDLSLVVGCHRAASHADRRRQLEERLLAHVDAAGAVWDAADFERNAGRKWSLATPAGHLRDAKSSRMAHLPEPPPPATGQRNRQAATQQQPLQSLQGMSPPPPPPLLQPQAQKKHRLAEQQPVGNSNTTEPAAKRPRTSEPTSSTSSATPATSVLTSTTAAAALSAATSSKLFMKPEQQPPPPTLTASLADLPVASANQLQRLLLSGDPRSTRDVDELAGRLGERLAADWLRSLASFESQPLSEIVWLNEQAETGQPYDIELRLADGQALQVEVKSSAGEAAGFHLSLPELRQALAQPDTHRLLRVLGLASGRPRLALVPDLIERLRRGHYRLLVLPAVAADPASPTENSP